jgi:drug/metabolite transporter (DMT)-like permease
VTGWAHSRWRGYGETFSAALVNGSIGTIVSYATMPVVMLVSLRMAFAAGALALVLGVRRSWPRPRDRATAWRLVLLGLVLAANLTCYFIAIRETGVAIAIFTSYLAPVYVAVVAPRFSGGRTEPVVIVALAVALAGMLTILVPGLRGAGLDPGGLAAGVAAGAFYAVYLLLSKNLRRAGLEATGIVFVIAFITAVVLLPWGLAQSTAADFTAANVLMAVILGVVTTALTFSLFIDGMHFIKVQHASIMGYIEPVSAPLYAFLILGQRPSGWTLAGGALIVAAGVAVVALGKAEEEVYG